MTVKDWLSRARGLDREIDMLLEEQQEALLSATGTVPKPSEVKVQTSRRNSSEDRFINYAAYSELINRRIDELYAVKQEIMQAISNLENGELRQLLILRYVRCMNWDKVAEKMGYSYVHVAHRLHKKALKEFEEKYEKNETKCNRM